MRLSSRLSEIYGISRRNAKKYITEGRVKSGGLIIRKDIETDEETAFELELDKTAQTLDPLEFIISKKGSVIFFYKPPFMHTERHTPEDPPALEDLVPATHRLISRLDYETDGIIAALEKSAEVEEPLKKYTAVVKGDFPEKLLMDNIIDAAKRKKVRVTDKKGGYAVLFRKKTAISGYSVVEAELEYAARHQLRAFLAHAGFPIVGDKTYDGEEFPRLLLHCGFTRINGVQEYSKHQDIFLDYFMKHL